MQGKKAFANVNKFERSIIKFSVKKLAVIDFDNRKKNVEVNVTGQLYFNGVFSKLYSLGSNAKLFKF